MSILFRRLRVQFDIGRRALAAFALCVFLAPGAFAKDVVRLPVPYMQQPDGSTCLPTSLAMAMHFMGRIDLTTSTIFEMHKVCRTDRYNVPDLMREYGLYAFPSWLEHAWTRETIEEELRQGRPVVMGVDISRAGHFVLAVGYTDDGKLIIHDPANPHPGWAFNGAYTTTTWDKLIWRNGIMLRGEPFPAPVRQVSGTLVDTTAPRTMTYGEEAFAEFAIKNNGSVPWPEGVQLAAVDAYSSPTRERESVLAILPGDTKATSGTWISASRAANPSVAGLPPGEVAYFRVPLRAPDSLPGERSVTFRENFNLIDAQGHWFSEHWLTGPSNRQVFFRVAVVPPRPANFKLPLIETFEGRKTALPWKYKNGSAITLASNAPPFPQWVNVPAIPADNDDRWGRRGNRDDEGTTPTAISEGRSAANSEDVPPSPPAKMPGPNAGTAILSLMPPPDDEYQMAIVGDPLGTDYRVEAWVYCEYRPIKKGEGCERVGIFMHDSGQHRITSKTELENGDCLLMAFDSDDGKIRAGNYVNGGVRDAIRQTSATTILTPGWHHFAIRATGPTVTYELDGAVIGTTSGSSRAGRRSSGPERDDPKGILRYGDCGVFTHALSLPQLEKRKGLLFADFKVLP